MEARLPHAARTPIRRRLPKAGSLAPPSGFVQGEKVGGALPTSRTASSLLGEWSPRASASLPPTIERLSSAWPGRYWSLPLNVRRGWVPLHPSPRGSRLPCLLPLSTKAWAQPCNSLVTHLNMYVPAPDQPAQWSYCSGSKQAKLNHSRSHLVLVSLPCSLKARP